MRRVHLVSLTLLLGLLARPVPAEAVGDRTERAVTPGSPARPQNTSGPGRVEVRGEWIYVDGEPFLVKGIGYSPYRPGQNPWKDLVDTARMESDLQRIREAGLNTIRTWAPLPPFTALTR